MDKKIPAVPSLDGIQDPAVKSVLQTLFDGWSVRNGNARDQGAQFVTRDDMEHFLGKGSWQSNLIGGGSVGNPNMTAMAPGGITTAFKSVISGIIDNIKNSALWKDLSKRIDAADATATSAGLLGQEALLVVTETDGTIRGAWSVKFDADGYVVGAGLGIEGKDGNYTSQFLVRADRFALGSPSTEDLFPFIVDTHNGQSVIALNGQVYIGATPASEIGSYTSYVFKESATQPATPTGTTPVPAGWSDSPSGTYTNPIWMSKATITASTGLAGTWSAPVKVTGQDGSAGKYTTYQYAKNTSLTTQPTTGWQSAPYSLATGEYQWMRSGQVVPPATEPVAWGSAYRVTGEKGDGGAAGSNGTNGTNGVRGSVTAYASGSAWSDTTANSAIASVTSTNYKVIGDTVIISNGSSFAATKYWSGIGWVAPGVVIDGNLLVSGTVSASKIGADTMAATNLILSTSYGNVQFGHNAGSTLSTAYFSGATDYAIRVASGGVWIENGTLYAPPLKCLPATGLFTIPSIASGVQPISVYGWNANGIRGQYKSGGTSTLNATTVGSGVIGASGYSFYAEIGSYGPFTGCHDSCISKGSDVEIGSIMVDVKPLIKNDVSNVLCEITTSTSSYQYGVVGVYVVNKGALGKNDLLASINENRVDDGFGTLRGPLTDIYYEIQDEYDLCIINSLGEGQVLVCGENGNIEVGDLIVTSSMPGKGMKQEDDVVRSYTVAKSREKVTFSSPDEVKLVACIYLCG